MSCVGAAGTIGGGCGRTAGAFTYELKGNGTAVITKFDWSKHSGGDVYVPRSIDGYNVTEIGARAFSGLSKTTRLLDCFEDEVYAYYEDANDLRTKGEKVAIILPDTISVIGEMAFCYTSITACNIPENVHTIGAGAFACCPYIKQFSVNSRNKTFATIDGVLFNKTKKELIAFPLGSNTSPYTIPEGIQSIGDYAFCAADTTIIGSQTVKHIGDYALAYCKLYVENKGEPMSPHTIGAYAFLDANFESNYLNRFEIVINLAELKELSEGAFREANIYDDDISGLSQSSITAIPSYAFYDTTCWLELPETVTTIGSYAYAKCNSNFERKAHIPSSVVAIEDHAFFDSSFNIVFDPDAHLTTIGDYAFSELWLQSGGEQELTLPSSVESLGTKAFYDALTLLVVPESVVEIGDDVVNRTKTVLRVASGSYADIWASENGYPTETDDTSWLFE